MPGNPNIRGCQWPVSKLWRRCVRRSDEAILLADRVVTMRDGRLAAEHGVASEARDRGSAPFAALRHALLGALGVVEPLEHP